MNDPVTVTNIPLQEAVARFMQKGDQTLGRFNAEQATLYVGLCLEEMSEILEAIAEGCVTREEQFELLVTIGSIKKLGKDFKSGLHLGDVLRSARVDVVDGAVDLAWVALGLLASTSKAPQSCIDSVASANLDKYRNGVIKDANGKIMKPHDWTPPDLSPFVEMPE